MAAKQAKEESMGLQIPKGTKLPKKVQKKLENIKKKVEKFKTQVLKKFDKYILGVSLLPPPRPKEGEKINKDNIYVLVVIDDSDSKRMTKYELKNKLTSIIEKIGAETDKNMIVETKLLSEIWQSCYDGKHEILQKIAMSAPVYDKGLLRTLKITEVHKSMVLKRFEKYIVSYVLGGSIYKGTARDESDIDLFIIVDDTDVKRMTRGELRDKLRHIMYGMASEASMLTGIKNKLHLQVWILTDYWDALKESSPVIFDTLRFGIPLYDRGMFMPWRQLLKMGKIKPSREAIELFKNTGDQALKRVEYKLSNMAMDEIFLAMLTPTQAALMLYGVQPQGPRETPQQLRDIFVKKGLLEEKYVKILEHNLKIRKDIEHGKKKEVSGKEVDKLLTDAKTYLERIKKVFEELHKQKEVHVLENLQETVNNVTRDALKVVGIERVADKDLIKTFDEHLVHTSQVGSKYLKILKNLLNKHKRKLEKNELAKFQTETKEYIKYILDFTQRTHARELEKLKIKIKYGNNFGEITITPKQVFVLKQEGKKKDLYQAKLKADGSLGKLQPTTIDEMDKTLKKHAKAPRVTLKPALFESIKKIFGEDADIFLNN